MLAGYEANNTYTKMKQLKGLFWAAALSFFSDECQFKVQTWSTPVSCSLQVVAPDHSTATMPTTRTRLHTSNRPASFRDNQDTGDEFTSQFSKKVSTENYGLSDALLIPKRQTLFHNTPIMKLKPSLLFHHHVMIRFSVWSGKSPMSLVVLL